MMKQLTSIYIGSIGLFICYVAWKGALGLFILPEFHLIVLGSGVLMILLSGLLLWKERTQATIHTPWYRFLGLWIMIGVILLGFFIPLRPLSSATVTQRGVGYDEPALRTSTSKNIFQTSPEKRSLVDWLRQLASEPEPRRYVGQPVRVEGFISPFPGEEDTFMIAKFLIACCSADARPIGLPLVLEGQEITVDNWVRIEGTMTEITIDDTRRAAIKVEHIISIPVPDNPYEYL